MTKGKGRGKGRDPEAVRAHLRRIRIAQPNLRHGLYASVSPAARTKAENRLYRQHPHLKKADRGRVRTLAHLDALLEQAWKFFSTPGRRIASATKSGKTTWDPGLSRLLALEELRLKLSRELCITPRSRVEASTPDWREALAAIQQKVTR